MKQKMCILIIIILLFALLIVSGVICSVVYNQGKMNPIIGMENDNLYYRAINNVNNWLFSEFAFMTVYIILSVMPFFCTVSILYLEVYYSSGKAIIIVISIVSLSLMSISYFLKPNLQAQMYRKAYEVLKPAIVEYESKDVRTKQEREALREAITTGEKYIGSAI